MDYTLKYTTNFTSLITEAYSKPKVEYPTYNREQQINAIARTLFKEARGEKEAGMRRVLDSIIARSGNNIDNIVGVISEPFQYSCWNDMSPHDWNPSQFKPQKEVGADKDVAEWDTAVSLATKTVDGTYTPKHTEPFYHTTSSQPKWSRGKTGKVDGNHIFYTNKEINGTDKYRAAARYNMTHVNDKTLLSPNAIIAQRKAAREAATRAKQQSNNPKMPNTAKQPTVAKQPIVKRPLPSTPQPTKSSNSTYVVKDGDTVSSIAKNLGSSVSTIAKLNPGMNPDVIKIGQKLNIPN